MRHLGRTTVISTLLGVGIALLSGCASAIKTGPGIDVHFPVLSTRGDHIYGKITEEDMAGRTIVTAGRFGDEQFHFYESGNVWISRADISGLQGTWKMGPEGSFCISQRWFYPGGRCWHVVIDEQGKAIGIERVINSIGVTKAKFFAKE